MISGVLLNFDIDLVHFAVHFGDEQYYITSQNVYSWNGGRCM